MTVFKPSVDVRPVTEFRSNTSSIIEQVQSTGRPVVLTQHGRSAVVLLDIHSYEHLIEEIELLRAIRVSEEELDAGAGLPHEEVVSRLRRKRPT